MKLLSLEDAWEEFLHRPTCASFTSVRECVLKEDSFTPSALVLVELSQLLAGEEYTHVLERVEELMPAWAICPRIHFLAGSAAEALDDAEESELCQFLSSTCVDGILSTGDGSRNNPWLVTYPSDAQDCLARLGLSVKSQQLVNDGDAMLDIIQANNDRIYCFDVSDLIAASAEVPAVAGSVHG